MLIIPSADGLGDAGMENTRGRVIFLQGMPASPSQVQVSSLSLYLSQFDGLLPQTTTNGGDPAGCLVDVRLA
jgi:hypothetical protein